MDIPIFLLRKALGLTQQQMAEALGCGYSTLQNYEGGKKLAPEVRAAAVNLAYDRKLPQLADLLGQHQVDAATKLARYNPKNTTWHNMLETVLESGDKRANDAVQSNLVLFHAWVQKIKEKKE
jgi:predicted transcriptional regulator